MKYRIKYGGSHYNDADNYPIHNIEEKVVNSIEEAKQFCAEYLAKEVAYNDNLENDLGIIIEESWDCCTRYIYGIFPETENLYNDPEVSKGIKKEAEIIAENMLAKKKKEVLEYRQICKIRKEEKEKAEYLKLKEKYGDKL